MFELSNADKRRLRLIEARKKGTHTKEEWQEMKDHFGYTCVKCYGASGLINIEKDHIIPLYQGGSDSIKNLQPLCARCNSAKGPENVDHRISFCENTGIEMPAKWLN